MTITLTVWWIPIALTLFCLWGLRNSLNQPQGNWWSFNLDWIPWIFYILVIWLLFFAIMFFLK